MRPVSEGSKSRGVRLTEEGLEKLSALVETRFAQLSRREYQGRRLTREVRAELMGVSVRTSDVRGEELDETLSRPLPFPCNDGRHGKSGIPFPSGENLRISAPEGDDFTVHLQTLVGAS